MGAETDLKNWFRKKYSGWSDVHEPRRSLGQGFPDVTILVRNQRVGGCYLVPIEFKVGRFDTSGRLLVSGFEPAQVSWHYNFRKAGGYALIAVGVKVVKQGWELWEVTPGDWMREWKLGVPVNDMRPWLQWAP